MGEYIPKEKYQFMFPDDRELSSEYKKQLEETQDILVGVYEAFRDPLVQSHEAAKASSVNTLPTNDFLKRFGGFFQQSMICNVCI